MNIKSLVQAVIAWGSPPPISKKEARRRNNVLPAYFDPANQPGSFIKDPGRGADRNATLSEIGRRSQAIRRVKIAH